jgi:hypothetical protein
VLHRSLREQRKCAVNRSEVNYSEEFANDPCGSRCEIRSCLCLRTKVNVLTINIHASTKIKVVM